MVTFYVARPLDKVTGIPDDLFRVRILTVHTMVEQAIADALRRKIAGENDIVIVTDEWESRVKARRARQVIVAKVGPGTPGSARFTTWS